MLNTFNFAFVCIPSKFLKNYVRYAKIVYTQYTCGLHKLKLVVNIRTSQFICQLNIVDVDELNKYG